MSQKHVLPLVPISHKRQISIGSCTCGTYPVSSLTSKSNFSCFNLSTWTCSCKLWVLTTSRFVYNLFSERQWQKIIKTNFLLGVGYRPKWVIFLFCLGLSVFEFHLTIPTWNDKFLVGVQEKSVQRPLTMYVTLPYISGMVDYSAKSFKLTPLSEICADFGV